MTDQERHKEFMVEYRKLVDRTGYQITPGITSKHLSQAALELLCELRAGVELVPSWSPPEAKDGIITEVENDE